jgi:hypothetical protein
LQQLYQAEKLRRTGLIEAVYYYERIARCPVLHIQALGARAEALQGFPRVAGSAA